MQRDARASTITWLWCRVEWMHDHEVGDPDGDDDAWMVFVCVTGEIRGLRPR